MKLRVRMSLDFADKTKFWNLVEIVTADYSGLFYIEGS